jgi:hypothetical protein
MTGPELVLLTAAAYAAAGLAFAVAFVTRGAAKLDPAAREASWAFRLLIMPGSAALWPLLAAKWARAQTQTHADGGAA